MNTKIVEVELIETAYKTTKKFQKAGKDWE